jgi:hypothetical protein
VGCVSERTPFYFAKKLQLAPQAAIFLLLQNLDQNRDIMASLHEARSSQLPTMKRDRSFGTYLTSPSLKDLNPRLLP